MNDPGARSVAKAAALVRVERADGHARVVACAALVPGDRIMLLEGDLVPRPSRYSIQYDETHHIEVPANGVSQDGDDPYAWRFLNHSCRPNARVRARELLAVRAIAPGDEITFDYETTEWQLACPFTCRCGTCDGRHVRGFRFLPPAERESRTKRLAEHLLARIDAPVA